MMKRDEQQLGCVTTNSKRSLRLMDSTVSLPDALSVPIAITHLKTCLTRPRSVSHAVAVLKQFSSRRPLCHLYRHYFPLEWERSVANGRVSEGGGLSAREVEFLRLVDTHLFPFDWREALDALDEEETMMEYVQLRPYATSWWDEDDESYRLGWRLCIAAFGPLYEDEAQARLLYIEELIPSVSKIVADFIRTQSNVSAGTLRVLTETAPWPLCELPSVVSLLTYDTGNPWLDVPGDEGSLPFDECKIRWCKEHFDVLARRFREAQAIEQRAQDLIVWLEGDPNSRMLLLVEAVKRAKAQAA